MLENTRYPRRIIILSLSIATSEFTPTELSSRLDLERRRGIDQPVRAQSIPGTGSDLSATKVGTEGVPGAGAHVRGPELESNESEFRSDWSNVLEQE